MALLCFVHVSLSFYKYYFKWLFCVLFLLMLQQSLQFQLKIWMKDHNGIHFNFEWKPVTNTKLAAFTSFVGQNFTLTSHERRYNP